MFNSVIIENFLKNKKISKTKLCKICKISPETFHRIINNDKTVSKIALFKVARFLKIEISTLL